MKVQHTEDHRPSRFPVLLAWLSPIAAVAIAMTATRGVPVEGAGLEPASARIIGMALLIGGVLCLVGVALGLRAVMRRPSSRLGAAWPFLVAAPAGAMLLLAWGLFFSA